MLLTESLLGTSSASAPVYVEDVFSTDIYEGTGYSQAIGNSIQLGNGATTEGWVKRIITSGATRGLKVDSSGNIYIAGTSSSDIYVAKYNSAGTVQWQRTLSSAGSDSGMSIDVDSSGNVYVCGSSTSGANGSDIQVVKYDSSGTLQWQNILRSVDGDYGTGISVDSSGNVFITGSTSSSSLFGVVAKINSSGTLQWQRSIEGGTADSDSFEAVTTDSNGDVYAVGYAYSSAREAVLVKYNTSGTASWQRKITTADNTYGLGVTTDSSNNVYVAGYADASKIFVVKFNSSGTSQWITTLTNSSGSTSNLRGIVVDSSGNVYVGGTKNNGSYRTGGLLVMKFNSSGTLQWQRDLKSGITTSSTVNGGSLALLNNDLYVLGTSFDNSTNGILAKLPTDGTGLGSYLVNDFLAFYVESNFTTTTAFTVSTSTFSLSTSSLTYTSSSLTDASASLTTYTATIPTAIGKGGMVWLKSRSGATDHALYDTARGATFDLVSNSTAAQTTQTTGLTSFNGNGFNFGALAKLNTNGTTYASWTFRKQAKFFDVVTWTGNGTLPRVIPHNLGSVPGCIIAKRTDIAADWYVYHRSLNGGVGPEYYWMLLNTTGATAGPGSIWDTKAPTSTGFNVGGALNTLPGSGITPTYVAYVFAHNAGGFGASGADSVISCGSTAENTSVNLGWEPQWLLIKNPNIAGSWEIHDNIRALNLFKGKRLFPNNSDAEYSDAQSYVRPNSTGFSINSYAGSPWIYIAIRRGPMKTPTSGTSVFSPIASTAPSNTIQVPGFPVDAQILSLRSGTTYKNNLYDRLRGVSSTGTEDGLKLITSSTDAETSLAASPKLWDNISFRTPSDFANQATIFWNFRRAPGFFDVVCYTGTGAVNTLNHNLGVVPEIWIIKRRTGGAGDWFVGGGLIGSGTNALLNLNTTAATVSGLTNLWLTPTSTTFGIGSYNPSDNGINASGSTYVAYLFATVAGVSKVGSYTGSGTTKQIDCGFTSGARFVLIKRTDSTGNWYVWDSARGIVAANDPYLLLNSTAAESTGTDYIDTYSAGFEISSTAPAAINASGGTFIFLAIA